jgi:GAF domain-containing protein
MPFADPRIIKNPSRVSVMRRLELLDSPTETAFDRLTQLASKVLNAPVSLVSLVDADRQFFKSFVGLPEPWASQRETPLSHSFCQHVVATNEPLVITDSREHPLVHDNMAIPDLNVIAYLGMPLTIHDGTTLGSFCVIDGKPRIWSQHEIEVVRELAQSVMVEIELRAELLARHETEQRLQEAYIKLDERNQGLTRVTELCRSTIDHMLEVMQRGAPRDEILTYLHTAQRTLDRQSQFQKA